MAYRLGQPLDYDPFDDEDSVIDSPADSEYSLGEATDFDPFANDPKSSDTDEPDDGGHSLWDIPRLMGKGAAGVAKTASIAFALTNPTEWANRAIGVVGDITQNEAMQAYRDYSQKHSVSAKLRQYGETAEDYYDEKLTPAMKKSMEKTILASGEEEGFWGPGIKDPWKIGGMIAESLPSTALSMGSGALITKGLAATGFKNAPKIVQGVLQKLIKKYGVNSVAGAIGGGVGEGVYSGLDNANQAFEEMMATPQAELSNSATYQEIFNSLPEKFSTEQKHAYARKILSMATGGFVGSLTAVSTGILGAPSGAFVGKLMGGQGGKSFWGNLLKGAFSEGIIEEMPQSGMEKLITNFTKKFLVDPNQRLLEGTGEAMAGGAIAGIFMGGGMAAVAGREGKTAPIKPELESDAKKILQGDQGDITARDILLGPDRAEQIRKATEGQRYTGQDSIEAEEEAGQYTEEELAELTPKEAPGDRKGGKQIPGKKPQRKEPKPPPLPKKGKAAPSPGGVLQKKKADEARQIKAFGAFVKKLTPRQRSRIQDLIDDKKMPIAERIGLAKAELIKPAVERRTEAKRLPWDAHFRALMGEAKKQSLDEFVETGTLRAEAGDPAILDLAKRLGQPIEPGYPVKDTLKTIYSRIQSGAEPRKRTEEMSKQELQKELNTDYLTGLGNKHAFEIEDTRKAHVASIDLDSLKYFNDAFGHQTGDEMLKNFGAALTPIEGSYHISGDEFIVQNDDTRALQEILENQIPKNLAANPITITLPDGKKIKYEVQFSYGTAKTISDAEQRLQAHKASREVAGERAGRGEIPAGLPGGPTKGRGPGDQRQEVPKTELEGGPRRAPMRTTRGETDSAAKIKKEMATIDTDPTEGQKAAGNYSKAHFKYMGFDVTIENKKGATRSGTDESGKKWSQKMANDYGYFARSEGKDGDEIDLFRGDNPDTKTVYIVHQVDETGKPDEDKVMLGFVTEKEATDAYFANYEEGWTGFGSISAMDLGEFAAWLQKETDARKAKKKPKPKPLDDEGKFWAWVDTLSEGEKGAINLWTKYGIDNASWGWAEHLTKAKSALKDKLEAAAILRGEKPGEKPDVQKASSSDILIDYRLKDHKMDFGDMSEEIGRRGLKFLGDIGWSTKDDARYLRRDGTYSDRRPTVTLKELLEKGADPESSLYGDGMEFSTLVRLWEPLDIRHITNRLGAIGQWVADNPDRKMINLDYLDMPTNKKAEISRTTRPEKELAHLRESFKIPIKDKMPAPAKKEEYWSYGHLQTPDRPDRWWTDLFRARVVLNDIVKATGAEEWAQGIDTNSLKSIVAAIDSVDEIASDREPIDVDKGLRDLTIKRLGDIGTKVRFKKAANKEIMTITNIAPNGKVSVDNGNTYHPASILTTVTDEEIKITAQPDIPAAKGGNETKVITPGNRRGYNARYSVVESNDLIPSHDARTFQKNPDYPEGIQERTYHTDTREQEKVIKNAQHLSNAILLSDDPTPTNGPPIVTPGGIVLGGNSRTMSIARAYRGKHGDRYKKALVSGASKWGMRPAEITEMDKPVLVRRVYLEKGDIDTLHRMASDFNKSLTQGISQEAEIASMGRNMSMDTVEKIGLRMANRDLTIRELLGKSDGLEILNWLIQDDVIPATDENRFVNRKVNLLNEPGKILIEKAIFGSIIDDADLISAAPKVLTNKIGRALPSLARIKARGDQWDITPEVKSALQLATEAHAADLSIRDHLAQGSLFGDKKQYDNMVVGLAELLVKDKQIALATRFKNFAADAMADVKDQGFLFEPKSFQEAIKDAFDLEIADRESLFAAIPAEQMSPKEYLDFIRSEAKAGRESGIIFKEKVEIEETGETVERETDAVAYLNEIEDELAGYRELLKCVKGAT